MPYRRLPNTDSARLRAMQKALVIAEKIPPYQLAYNISTYQELKYFFPEFKQTTDIQKESLERQAEKNKKHIEYLRKARLFISHFIQVLNFSIIRGELKLETRNLFNLEEYDKKLPRLNTENDIIKWGERIIAGEEKRLFTGQSPVTNPSIARVKVHYEDFLRIHKNQKYLQESHNKALIKISVLRDNADRIILTLWNEIENTYNDLDAEEKRVKCASYGVVYVYRKHEKLSFSNLKLDNM